MSPAPTERPADLPTELRDWVQAVTGGSVVSSKRVPAGGQRHGYLVDVGSGEAVDQALYLSHELRTRTADLATSRLRTEAGIFRCLVEHDVPAPAVVAVHPSIEAMLMQRVEGSANFGALGDPAQRTSVAQHFMSCLAAIHRIDPNSDGLQALGEPGRVGEHLLAYLAEWTGAYRAGAHGGDPVLEFGLRWLYSHRPAVTRGPALVQGDTGPGNFLYQNGQVTAVLDWELAHFGDPQEDLGWLSMRCAQDPLPEFATRLAEYSDAVGTALDLDAIRYYRVLAEWVVASIGHTKDRAGLGDSERGNAIVYEQLHRRLLVESIVEAGGGDLGELPRPLPTGPDETPRTWIYDMALDQLRDSVVPRMNDPLGARRAKGVARTVKILREMDRLQEAVEALQSQALAELLDPLPTSIAQARQELSRRIADGEFTDEQLLRYAWVEVNLDNEVQRSAMGRLADRHHAPLIEAHPVGAR